MCDLRKRVNRELLRNSKNLPISEMRSINGLIYAIIKWRHIICGVIAKVLQQNCANNLAFDV